MFINKTLTILLATIALTACARPAQNPQPTTSDTPMTQDTTANTNTQPAQTQPDKYVTIKTTLGDIVIQLYDDTPLHQQNFIKLVNQGYYNNTLFHRVINKFMIQAGDPDSKNAPAGKMLGSGGPGYTIDAEIDYPRHYHKRGALAAARQGDQVNPQRKSSGSQFYIVTGDKLTPAQAQQLALTQLDNLKQQYFQQLAAQHTAQIQQMQMTGNRQGLMQLQQQLIDQTQKHFADTPAPQLPQQLVDDYTTTGGAPHLDGQYTVFGQVIKGMDIVDQIEQTPTDNNDRPLDDIKIISTTITDKP